MIGWDDIYKVVEGMAPLYFALVLGYGSVRWWHMFTDDHCSAINRFACYFIIPLFNFNFAFHVNPFEMNYCFLGADVISKVIVLAILVIWSNFTRKGSYEWAITCFSLSAMSNTLVVGVPVVEAMFDKKAAELVVQAAVLQNVLWFILILFLLEFRRTRMDFSPDDKNSTDLRILPSQSAGQGDLEEGQETESSQADSTPAVNDSPKTSFWLVMRTVWLKLAKNPNLYGCVLGLIWAIFSGRWNLKMPGIVEGSILIMAKAGSGISMFGMGLFMALQEKMISCGVGLTMLGMIFRFIVGPATMAIGVLATRLHGEVLRVAIIQAALPQAITSFVFAKEYGLHAELLSTEVILGTLVSLPLLVSYDVLMELVH